MVTPNQIFFFFGGGGHQILVTSPNEILGEVTGDPPETLGKSLAKSDPPRGGGHRLSKNNTGWGRSAHYNNSG